MNLQHLADIMNNSETTLYSKKRDLIREGLRVIDADEFGHEDKITHSDDVRDKLLELFEQEQYGDENLENKILHIINRSSEEEMDKEIIAEFSQEEWDHIDSLLDDSVDKNMRLWSLIIMMRNYLGNTRTKYAPSMFLLLSAVFLHKDDEENRIAGIRSTYKKYVSQDAHFKISKFSK